MQLLLALSGGVVMWVVWVAGLRPATHTTHITTPPGRFEENLQYGMI